MALGHSPSIVTSGLGMYVDAANPRSYSTNVHPYPLDIYGWAVGTNGACTISRDLSTSPSPAGGIPLAMAVTGNDPYMATYNNSSWNLAPAAAGQTWTVSVWVKASVNSTNVEGPIIFGCNSSGIYVTAVSAGSISVGTTWTRISYTTTLTDATTAYLQVRLDGPNTGGAGITYWWDGLQVERTSSPTTFNSKTNANNSTWFDISGNSNHLTLQNFGSITYNSAGYHSTGSTGYFNRASSTNTPTGNSPYCIGVWARQNGSWGTSNGFISVGGYGTANQSNALRTLNNTAGQFHHYWWSNDLSVNSSSATLGNWFMVLAQFDGTSRSVWVNNVLVATDTPSGHNVVSSALQVSQTNPGEYQQGDIAMAFIYNRALSSGEISQNFNALRGRYGI